MDSKRKFKFKLAGHLGMTVKELEQRMTYKELNEWIEYAKDEPLIADRLEMMLAQVVSTASGKPAFEHLVSLSNEDKESLAHNKMNTDFTKDMRNW